MKVIEILVVGTNEDILNTIIRLINHKEYWNGTGALTAEQAINIFKQKQFDVVLLGAGLTESIENTLCSNFRAVNPKISIVPHYGGGSGLLFTEIQMALDSMG